MVVMSNVFTFCTPILKDGRGAELVISDMGDLLPLVDFFLEQRKAGTIRPFSFPTPLTNILTSPFWVGGGSVAGAE